MGISIPEPIVVKMKNGQWFANGYDSLNYQVVLFIIDTETGSLVKSINTGIGSITKQNGLSSPNCCG